MCLEAAIYDYAAWHLPSLVVENVDKLDIVAKWKIVPYLITKRELPPGGAAHNALIALNKQRNALVHAKSQTMKHGDALFDQIKKANLNEEKVRLGCFEAMKLRSSNSASRQSHVYRHERVSSIGVQQCFIAHS